MVKYIAEDGECKLFETGGDVVDICADVLTMITFVHMAIKGFYPEAAEFFKDYVTTELNNDGSEVWTHEVPLHKEGEEGD